MNCKAARTRSRVNYVIINGWVKHFYAHINYMTRCKILSFFAFSRFYGKILKCFVNYLKIGIEQFHILKEGAAYLQMVRLQVYALAFDENSGPFLLRLLEKGVAFSKNSRDV